MTFNSTRIAGLIYRSLSGRLEARDQQELLNWLQASSQNQAFYDEIMERQDLPVFFEEQAPESLTLLRNELLGKIRSHISREALSGDYPSAGKSRIPVYKAAWFRYTAAAILILAAGMVVLFAVTKRAVDKKAMVATPGKAKDIPPGGNRATLVLGDGTTISLDSAANGAIATQGNAAITKLKDGQIAYIRDGQLTAEVVMNKLSTPRGGQYQLTLPDGTRVWLNAASSITYPALFTEKNRAVSVTGEVYFEVSKNASKPFIVNTPKGKIEVLGTHFNVNTYGNEEYEKTTLLEGSIRVSLTSRGERLHKVILRPGQQARLDHNLTVAARVNTDQVMAWKNGFFSMEDVSLKQIMNQLERWYDIQVQYEGAIPQMEFKGKINRGVPLSAVIGWFYDLGIPCTLDGKTLTVKNSTH